MMNWKITCMAAVTAALIFLSGPLGAQQQRFEELAGGVKARSLQEGMGPAAEDGMIATIHFVGWLNDSGVRGRELYNSRREGTPVSFVVGTDGVMPAWNVGVKGMRAGGRRMLHIPPAMAYGERGVAGEVPPNAPLMFQIELLSLEPAVE